MAQLLMTTGIPDADLMPSRTQMMKMLEVPSYFSFHVNKSTLGWLLGSRKSGQRPTYQLSLDPSGFIVSARLVFETRAKCQDFVARYKDDGVPYEVDSPCCNISTTTLVRQSKSPEDRETRRHFAPLWEVLFPKLREIFPGRDAKGNYIVPSLDARPQILSIDDRKNGAGKPVFKLVPPDISSCLISLLLICVNPVFLMLCCDKLSLAISV